MEIQFSDIPFHLADGGPIYRETNPGALLVEPWNAATAIFFLGIALYWVIRLKGNFRNYLLFSFCVPILAIGGFGGALYHGFRSSTWFLLMDVLPIFGLGLAVSAYLWLRILKKTWQAILILGCFALFHFVIGKTDGVNPNLMHSLEYANLGLMILAPLFGVLLKTKFRYWWLVLSALFSFSIALVFRIRDMDETIMLSMGTHWLWHTFGAMAVFLLSRYMFRLISLRNRALRLKISF